MQTDGYHSVRFGQDPRRDVLWKTLCEHYFGRLVAADFSVLDIGSGYANFINNIKCSRRIAVDLWERLPDFVEPGVEARVGPVDDLSFLDDSSVDFVFASNVCEHLDREEFDRTMEEVKRILKPGGTLNILQPNYRFAYREYFDDYTHQLIFSDVSMCDALQVRGFEVLDCQPRFLPLTVKSRLPVSPWLIRLYLALPFRPLGKQMFIRAKKPEL